MGSRKQKDRQKYTILSLSYAVDTCEIKLVQNYFGLRRRPSEIILFQQVETCLKLFQNYFARVLQLMRILSNMFIVGEIILK